MSLPPIHVIVPVWGNSYVRCFLDVGLRSLLSPGNLPSLDAAPRSVIHLFTTQQDFAVIEASPVWRRAAEVSGCRVEIIGTNAVNVQNPHATMSDCHRQAIEYGDAVGAAMVFYNPDIVMADGAIRAMVQLLAMGKRAIQVIGLRLQKESVVPLLLRDHVIEGGRALQISNRELMRLAMPNLHEITRMHIDGETDCELMPQEALWLAGMRGMVARCFHIHPILVYPRVRHAPFSTTVDDDYLRAACPAPEDEYVIWNSDEFCLCELSSRQRALMGLPRQPNNRDIAQWAWTSARAHHLEHFSRRIFLHSDGMEGPEWEGAVNRSDAAVNRVFAHLLDFEFKASGRA